MQGDVMNKRFRTIHAASICGLAVTALSVAEAESRVQGRLVDLNGRGLSQAMVTLAKQPGAPGATAVTVSTDADGRFQFPEGADGVPTVRLLGYRLVDTSAREASGAKDLMIVMRPDANQAPVAPASAWLSKADPNDKTAVIMQCVGCHQIPSPSVRNYAAMIHDTAVASGAAIDAASEQSWHSMVQYMNYVSAWEFGRGVSDKLPEPNRVYSGGEAAPTSKLLARTLTGRLQELEGYEYGAPLLVNERTVIREYEVPPPNAIREAVTLGDSSALWAADVSANRIVRIDTATGALRDFQIPSERIMGPHTLVRAKDDSLWVAPFFNGIVARLEPKREQWKVWQLKTERGTDPGVHDLTFGSNHELVTDKRGRIWFSDIVNNAVGWFDPNSGKSGIYPVPKVAGRDSGEALYGIVMQSDRTRVWYSQLGIGSFGSFNTETLKFETSVQLPDKNSGPRRVTVSDQDILYVPLYGSGQLVEYDARARRMIGIYDLPDRASAPYAVTWDNKRKVLWIPTSNADAIYRFDPRDKSFAVLPLPRDGAFLRMLHVDTQTGALVTSYANIVENVHGPRMALMIDLGDRSGPAQPQVTKR